jgi:two-component system sensor histidine kinase MtrB
VTQLAGPGTADDQPTGERPGGDRPVGDADLIGEPDPLDGPDPLDDADPLDGPDPLDRRGPAADAVAETDDDAGQAQPPSVLDEPDGDAPPRRSASMRIGDRIAAFARGARSRWRRSVQLRVATVTVVAASVLVLIIGLLLVSQISGGILDAKRRAAVAQASVGLETARRQLASVASGDVAGVVQAIDQTTTSLSATGSNAGQFRIALLSADPTTAAALPDPVAIPQALRKSVEDGNLSVQYAPVVIDNESVRGLIVGAPVSTRAGLVELYYLFPLTAEQQTIALVQRTVLIAGLLLVFLVVAIVVLVTRIVVSPVRDVAHTAERLARGDLSQRVRVRGEDDLARLSRSFNDMATSLQGQIRRLEELSRMQRQFTSDVSHELRTPLTTVRMATELLYADRSTFPPELARSAELLRDELDRFENLLAELLEISRYDAGVARLDIEASDLRTVVAAAVDANRVLAERHGSDLVVQLPDQAVLVEMDPRRVERILRNLIGNALDHGEGRPVEITGATDGDALAVTVRDHGVGLRPGEAGLVFNRFWRGDKSRSRLTGGTGLGLAISLEDARLHRGWLQAWGQRGAGAQFRLTLPLRYGEEVSGSPLPLEPAEDAPDAPASPPRAAQPAGPAAPGAPAAPAASDGPPAPADAVAASPPVAPGAHP